MPPAQIRRPHLRIVAQLRRRALEADAAILQHVGVVGDAMANCSTSSIVTCSSFSRRMMRNTSSTSFGARPIDGSSRSRISGRSIRARPMASICCSPPDRVP
ncbi:hypothetical protein VP06_33350, partial [Methylobacterium aquaticum]